MANAAVHSTGSVRFFDEQFRKQLAGKDFQLNPFERLALPHMRGRVLDYGCGLGNLSVAAARAGCSVHALDASFTSIEHLCETAEREALAIRAEQADLREYAIAEDYDAIVCIGLLMFFDCATARAQLESLKTHVRPGGIVVINVLIEGTTYMDMFDPQGWCLFGRDELAAGFAGWEILHLAHDDFPAPNVKVKSFATIVARRPGGSAGS